MPLQPLKALKVLKLFSVDQDKTSISALTKLSELDVRLIDDPRQITLLSLLTKLKVYIILSFNVVDLVKGLINLEELTIYSANKFVLDQETFFRIVGLVRGRPKVLTLECR